MLASGCLKQRGNCEEGEQGKEEHKRKSIAESAIVSFGSLVSCSFSRTESTSGRKAEMGGKEYFRATKKGRTK